MTLGFLITYCHNDADLARRLIGQIQQHHPDAEILLVADGDARLKLNLPLEANTRKLKRPGTIAKYSQRTFDAAALLNADLIIQLDPDCHLQRPIRRWPEADVAGKTIVLDGETCLHGACWVMSQRAVREIAEAKPFRLEDYAGTVEPNGSASEDLGLSRGIKRVIPDATWAKFNDCWYSRLKNNSRVQPSYAITHPIKNR